MTLLSDDDLRSSADLSASSVSLIPFSQRRADVTVIILVVVNMLNYMDRFTIAGIPISVQKFYNIDDEQMGLLQTVFFVSYTLLSPIAGYFGDRWRRKYIMLMGLVLWVVVVLCSSFVPAELFNLFLFTRCLVGVGEASYSTIAPTILSDLYVGDARTKVLGFFYFAVPVGSGLGYMVGWAVTRLTNQWQWALRITPLFGVFCILLLLCLHRDPPRGQAEGAARMHTTSWLVDLRSLVLNPAFMFVSGGFTCSCFILGAVTWFGVQLIQFGLNATHDDPNAWKAYNVPLIFGAGLCLAGIIGVLLGSYLARYFRPYNARADALICATAQFIAAPILLLALVSPTINFFLCVFLVFFVQLLLCISWALVTDMTMSVVIPTRRATASAVQMIMTHALGDCISPAIVGAISVAISDSASMETQYLSLQRALFLTPFICVLGAFLFLMASLYLVDAKEAVCKAVEVSQLINDTYDSPFEVNAPDETARL